ncbi:MAG TPA: CocE/NonD family hydrolase [Propionibacteriaceae bacterium]|nr:CocE/NonD family hydrolase [Propionibacteriaceae bacterium]
MHPSLDRPWRRPGALSYAGRRIRAALRPPVEVSPAPPDLVKDVDVPVRLRDGVVLRLNVYRPRGDGPFPVIMSAHPYGKDALPRRTRRGWSLNLQYRLMNQPAPVRLSDETSWEAPDPVWWVGQGYAVINADTRGGGHSEGRGDLFSDQEAADIAELIGWAARQPWSNGRVGMLGVSYLAISQYKVAALQPPALKAICPWEGFTDAYRDFLSPGGVMETGFARIWLTMTRRLARVTTDLEAERRRHPVRDEWWERLTPDLHRITAPILVCTSFSDANLHSSGSMRAFLRVASPERHAYTHRGPKWAVFYGEQARAAQLAFFDRHLKERADVAPLPRVRLEVRDRRDRVVEVRDEDDWPLARTRWTRLYLGGHGNLLDAPTGDCTTSFELRRNAALFDYRFGKDTELTGPMSLRLHVSCVGTDDPRLFVGVEKWSGGRYVPFEGSYGYGRDRVASGRLRLALRGLDAESGTPHQPEHTFRTLQPLEPGEQVDVTIALSPSATLFRAGDTLRLLVAGRDLEPSNPAFGHFPARYATSRGGRATLRSTPDRPSFLEVPVIPAARPA